MPRTRPMTIAEQFASKGIVSPERARRAQRYVDWARGEERRVAAEALRLEAEMEQVRRYRTWHAVQVAARDARPGLAECARCGRSFDGVEDSDIRPAPFGLVTAVKVRTKERIPLRVCTRCPRAVEAR